MHILSDFITIGYECGVFKKELCREIGRYNHKFLQKQ
jgi:hypothetical protein